MKILVYGINFAPELTGIGKYSGEMVEYLTNKGHEVTVITAPPYYPDWQVQKPYKKWWYQTEVLCGAKVIRCPLYVPKQPNTLTRLLHLLDFALSSFFALTTQLFKKYDVIFTVEPTFFCVPATLAFAKLTGAKSWLHIQDYEIEAMFGLGMGSKIGFAKTWIFAAESFLMRRFDRVSSISQSMLRFASEKKSVERKKLSFFPNWSDVDFIHPQPTNTIYRDKWNLAKDDFVLMYSGNIGKKQGLEILLLAARHFLPQTHIKFLIVGDGAHKSYLQSQAQELPNVIFKPLQPYEELSNMLACADVHLVIQRLGAADLVLPSKLTNILAAGGLSIITAEKGTELGDFCENNHGIATRIDPESEQELIIAIKGVMAFLLDSQLETRRINTIARNYAENFLKNVSILHQFEQELILMGRK